MRNTLKNLLLWQLKLKHSLRRKSLCRLVVADVAFLLVELIEVEGLLRSFVAAVHLEEGILDADVAVVVEPSRPFPTIGAVSRDWTIAPDDSPLQASRKAPLGKKHCASIS
jgi:hypothetical protein